MLLLLHDCLFQHILTGKPFKTHLKSLVLFEAVLREDNEVFIYFCSPLLCNVYDSIGGERVTLDILGLKLCSQSFSSLTHRLSFHSPEKPLHVAVLWLWQLKARLLLVW